MENYSELVLGCTHFPFFKETLTKIFPKETKIIDGSLGVANRLKNVLEEKTNTQIAKTVVEDAVKFVEQVYTDLHGQEKLEKATEQITEVLRAKGIALTEAEIYMLIESAVYGLNEGWFKSEENKSIPAETEDKEETVVEEDKAE